MLPLARKELRPGHCIDPRPKKENISFSVTLPNPNSLGPTQFFLKPFETFKSTFNIFKDF